jgi:ATP-dependent exoDNAse (exonuclease V) beta subunit
MNELGLNPEQRAAVEATGRVFVSAGAGTGKTSVLVERFVRAVCDSGYDVDSILVITYTRKAAGELRARIRRALHDRGRHELARALDGAWISTIHGFCSRLLKAHPFAVGLDPRFREVDDAGAAVLRGEAFERALTRFCADADAERLRLLATYGAAGLRRMLTSVYETLRSAGRDLVLELGERPNLSSAIDAWRAAADCLAADTNATENQRRNAAEAISVARPGAIAERVLDLGALRCRGERAATYELARRAVERAALEELAARDRDLLQELLEGFAAAYDEAKRRESVVDFEDLQLAARDLLRSEPSIREAEALRFRIVMVDEFQDTNALQCELVDLLTSAVHDGAGDSFGEAELFTVGDEFQSIYGFRHADVEVFRARREEASQPLVLRRNYRSRPEVLAAVNHLFEPAFGTEYQPLAASGEFPDPVFGHPVELLVTDKASYVDTGEHWRRGEARHIARRVRELVDTGAALPGEIVLLFAAGTDAETYEEELRRAGLPTFRATGRGYFGQQQVVDLLSYLRLLQNRYDDRALATVLASPFVGVSNDTLLLLRRGAVRRPLFTALERELPAGLEEADERLVRAFLQRYERLVVAASRVSLERLCEQILVEHDYDLAVLARWDGRRRYANLRKLARLARSYETLRGTDIESFVRFVRDQEGFGAKELEAVAEEEGADVVRLLTIHAAKGLEFKIVIVADAGRDTAGPPSADEILALSDGRFGFKMVHPTRGDRRPVFGYEDVLDASAAQERAERLRLYYVAMTRAVDRLIVSGAVDPGRASDRETPIGWVIDRLGAGEEIAAAGREPLELERGGARWIVRVDRHAPEVTAPPEPEAVAAGAQLSLFDELAAAGDPVGPPLPQLEAIPLPPLHAPRRLSYSAIALFDTCSYRYYAERVLGLRPRPARGVSGSGAEGLAATEIGDAAHRLLELVPLCDPVPPGAAELAETVRGWYPSVTEDELGRIAGFVAGYCASSLAQRIASLHDVAAEQPFAFEHDGVLFHGRLDAFSLADGRAVVLDYKTNQVGERDPAEVVADEYALQRTVYALACLKAGATEAEVVYVFLERPEEPVAATFGRDDCAGLAAELSAAIARIRDGDFRPEPSEFACAGCPALDLVCAGLGPRGGPPGLPVPELTAAG